jgi:hypothetical protein
MNAPPFSSPALFPMVFPVPTRSIVLLGLIKIVLFGWIILTVVKWYRRLRSGNDRSTDADKRAASERRPDHPGNIVDAEFEDIDDTKR